MTRRVIVVAPETTLAEIVRLWRKTQVSGFPVVAEGHLLGMVTEGDLVRRQKPLVQPVALTLLDAIIPLRAGRSLKEDLLKHVALKAEELMTAPAITIKPEADISEAAKLLIENKIKRLPVLADDGQLVGIISRADLLEYLFSTLIDQPG
ncbi:MAG: CBS domain-containing protein [Cyanobacteria bacterium NC_groundwater_1444_Ag_S-0.65um_54_12]|nr:CBS domain-containing protein [Cyanobacteria bacterium NC_groundwater_1444_Ag_S-0.65um_54_12]